MFKTQSTTDHEVDHGADGVVAEFPQQGSRAHVDDLEIQELVESGQEDPNHGAQVDEGDDRDHDELADRLLEAGHAALPRDACAQGGDRDRQRHDENLEEAVVQFSAKSPSSASCLNMLNGLNLIDSYREDIGEDRDECRVQVDGELLRLGLEDIHHLEGVGASVAELVVGQQEEGTCGPSGDQEHEGDHNLVHDGHLAGLVEFRFLPSLEELRDSILECVFLRDSRNL